MQKTKKLQNADFRESVVLGGGFILVFLILWELFVRLTGAKFPGPIEVFQYIFVHLVKPVGQYTIQGHVGWSLSRVLVGYCLAAVSGICIGLVIAQTQTGRAILMPLFNLLRPIPPIAWAPLSILWFGIDESAKYFIIFIGAFVPFTMNTYIGAERVDPRLTEAALMLGASPGQLFRKITFPAIIPQIFAGAQVALTNAWMTVLGAEMVRSTEGAGWMILKGMEMADFAQIVAGMVVIGLTGFLIATLMRWLERHLIKWNQRGR